MIRIVNQDEVLAAWPLARTELERAFMHSGMQTAEDYLPVLLAGGAQLWRIGRHAWSITRMLEAKGGLLLEHVAVAGADMDAWLAQYVAEAESWARENGCKFIVFGGRRGWERKLKDYKVASVTYTKEI